MKSIKTILPLVALILFSCQTAVAEKEQEHTKEPVDFARLEAQIDAGELSVAYFASGCFWCVEAVFESVKGVKEAVSGYSGGSKANADYRKVSSGQTKHAEAVKVYYDPNQVSYETLLVVFFDSQDPTTPNRQGPDRGPQYRSAIFYQNDTERKLSEDYVAKLTADKVFSAPIVTEIVPFEAFYDAEDYHQDYERNHPNEPYIRSVSIPRLKRFQAKHPELLKAGH